MMPRRCDSASSATAPRQPSNQPGSVTVPAGVAASKLASLSPRFCACARAALRLASARRSIWRPCRHCRQPQPRARVSFGQFSLRIVRAAPTTPPWRRPTRRPRCRWMSDPSRDRRRSPRDARRERWRRAPPGRRRTDRRAFRRRLARRTASPLASIAGTSIGPTASVKRDWSTREHGIPACARWPARSGSPPSSGSGARIAGCRPLKAPRARAYRGRSRRAHRRMRVSRPTAPRCDCRARRQGCAAGRSGSCRRPSAGRSRCVRPWAN